MDDGAFDLFASDKIGRLINNFGRRWFRGTEMFPSTTTPADCRLRFGGGRTRLKEAKAASAGQESKCLRLHLSSFHFPFNLKKREKNREKREERK